MNKLSIISGFLGTIRNRYILYQEDVSIVEKMRTASTIDHIEGLELCYPADFEDPAQTKSLLDTYNMKVSAINFRSRRKGKWLRGSFSSQLVHERVEVVEDMKKAIDLAEQFGCYRVTTCPLNEGHDYIFEVDYTMAYDFFEETIGKAASYKPSVKVCIEYKSSDPRTRCLLGNAGETLSFCQRLGMPNVGVTLDFGHSIQAGERPAQSAVMLAREKRLFYVHLNDNDKLWDWDLIPGVYNFWDIIEFFFYLQKLHYNDWFAYDVFSKEIDKVDTFNVVTNTTRKLIEISSRLDSDTIEELLAKRNPSESFKYLYTIL